MKASQRFFIDPDRRRSLMSLRLWLALSVGVIVSVVSGTLPLLGRLAHPWALALAFPAGHVLFAFSRAFTRLSVRDGVWGLRASIGLLYRPYGFETLGFHLLLALAEELVFRVAPLTLLGGVWWHVPLVALPFAAVHASKRSYSILTVLDLWILGVVLGGLFLYLGDVWPLVVVHWVRNASVAKAFVRRDRLSPDYS